MNNQSVTIVIPWRDKGCPYRRVNLATIRQHIAPLKWPVILANNKGDFNRSAARNAGVNQATTDIVVIMDADILIPLSAIRTAVQRVIDTGHIVHPYNVIEYLNRRGHLVRRLPLSPGGCTVIRRSIYLELGGHDEGYKGWGYEDTDFNSRASRYGVEWIPGTATHKWHPSDKDVKSPQFLANRARYHALNPTISAVPDVVYRIRPGDDNDELRFSLRSLANIPHGQVWFIGHKPTWARNVRHLPGDKYNSKWENAFHSIIRACQEPDISDPFILIDDDMMFMQPCKTVTPWHYYPLDIHIARATGGKHEPGWIESLTAARDYLKTHGCPTPTSWEIHVPFLVEKAAALPMLEDAFQFPSPYPPQPRSIIANLTGRVGEWRNDVRIRPSRPVIATDLLSTHDSSLNLVRDELLKRFPSPSPYEAESLQQQGPEYVDNTTTNNPQPLTVLNDWSNSDTDTSNLRQRLVEQH